MRFPLIAPRQPLTGIALGAVLGIFLADLGALPLPLLYGSCIASAAAVCALRRTWSCWVLSAVVFATLHTLKMEHHPAAAFARELGERTTPLRVSGIVWSEPEQPRTAFRGSSTRFQLKVSHLEISGVSRTAHFLMNVTWPGSVPAYGDRVEMAGAARNIGAARNPGEFEVANYFRRQGIYSEIRARYPGDCRIIGHGEGNPLQAFGFKARRWMQTQLQRDLEDAPQIAALISSMVLGLRGETPSDVKELFQRTGTLHLFAVSGLNIAMLGALVWLILKPLRIHRAAAVLVTIPVLFAYAIVTGLSASCIRATIMGTMILLAYVFDRRPVLYNSLSAAAVIILAWDTNQLFSPGFQFSFALVFTIACLALWIQRRIEPLGSPDPFLPRPLWKWPQKCSAFTSQKFAAAFGVTMAAWAGSLLFTIGYFHLFSLAAILANLVAVPLAFAVLALGLLSVASSAPFGLATILANNANWLCAHLLLRSVELCALIPGGNQYVELPRLRPAPDCEVLVFDLDAGGATHLRSDGREWLLDCGSKWRYEQTILPYLRTRGVNQLDTLLLTHGDSLHIGGAGAALDDFQPQMIIDSTILDRSSTRRALHRELARRDRGKAFARAGDRFRVSDRAQLSVLHPPRAHRRSLADDKALVVRLECSGVRILFMSDSGFATEQWLIAHAPDLRADILVKGEHAKDLSGTLDFLGRVQPRAVVCAARQVEGVTDLDAWEEALDARNIVLFRQDRTGAVRISIKGRSFELSSHLGDQSFRSRAR